MKVLKNVCRKKLREVKTLRQTKKRYWQKIYSLKTIIEQLKNKNLLNDDASCILARSVGCAKQLFERQIKILSNKLTTKKFNPQLRSFALTLNFLSPKAYKYVRKEFDLALPHESTISKWYQTINGAPGFTDESFRALSDAA